MKPGDRLDCFIYLIYVLCCSTRLSLTSHPLNNGTCAIWANGTVDCRHQAFTTIPNDTFPNNTIKLDLSVNDLKKVPGHVFHTLRNLTWLDLSFNRITSLDKYAFVNLNELVYLNINSNDILMANESYDPELFAPLVNLRILHMEGNQCSSMKGNSNFPVAVSVLSNLQELYSDFPKNGNFTRHFQSLKKLQILSSSGYNIPRRKREIQRTCCVKRLYNDTFDPFRDIKIKHFRLAHSCLKDVDRLTFAPFRHLDSFDLTGNNHLGLNKAWQSLYGLRNRNISYLSLKSCNDFVKKSLDDFIPSANNTRFFKTICIDYLDISGNFIYIKPYSKKIQLSKPGCLRHLDMSVHMTTPNNLIKKLSDFTKLRVVNISHFCGDPSGKGMARFENFRGSFSVKTDDNMISKLQPLSMDLSYMPMSCTINRKEFTSLRSLNISGWNCSNFRNIFFSSLHNVTTLTARKIGFSNKLQRSNKSASVFSYMEMLQELDLSENEFTELPDNLFTENRQLSSLVLFDNKLTRIPLKVFETTSLLYLDLSKNVIQYLTSREIMKLEMQRHKLPKFQLKLGSNPFICKCESLEFLRWLNTTETVQDYGPDYFCRLPDGNQTQITEFMKTYKDFSIACVSRRWLEYGLAGVLLVIILLLAIVTYCRYRWNIHYWFYTNCRPSPDMLPERRFDYDVFVCYNHNDCHWVYQTLRPHLEGEERGLRLCLHHRDFPAGVEIHQNIVDAINNSRKVVLVVSNSFVQSSWGEYEIEMANMRSVQEGRSSVIICVLLEEVPVRRMPRTLLNLWHRVTFLEWPDNPREETQFWDRLMNAVE